MTPFSQLKESKPPPEATEAGDRTSESTQGGPARRQSSPGLLPSLCVMGLMNASGLSLLGWAVTDDGTCSIMRMRQGLSLAVSYGPSPVKSAVSCLGCSTPPFLNRKCQKALSACQALSKTEEECAARSSVLTSGCQLVHDSSSSLRNGRWEDGETAQPLKCLVRKHTCGHEFDFQTSYKKNGYGGKCLETPHPRCWGGRDRPVPGAHWSAILIKLGNSGFSDRPVLHTRGRAAGVRCAVR